ncbi:hypothetical protein J3R30DRAFT_617834 [Lentinula aciculospora]|uniref:Secreted protein n=1 Tax=Lentinula aciculospora TaxID=153920 RepID=A0A9W9DKE8_9AGAR|nr:hypothetical protein J3R30DRAFT_617834 [Lentinula aciculospora]
MWWQWWVLSQLNTLLLLLLTSGPGLALEKGPEVLACKSGCRIVRNPRDESLGIPWERVRSGNDLSQKNIVCQYVPTRSTQRNASRILKVIEHTTRDWFISNP